MGTTATMRCEQQHGQIRCVTGGCYPAVVTATNRLFLGKIVVDGEDFSINEEFQQAALALADQIHLDQVESAKCLLEALPDTSILGRSLIECAIIRHHQQRKYALDILRLFLEFEQLEDDFEEPAFLEPLKLYVQERIFQSKQRLATRCLKSMEEIRNWLSRVSDRLAASSTLGTSDELERWEFSRISLLQQHELLGVILCQAIEQRQASVEDFKELMKTLRKADKYDASLLHLMPSVGAFISAFGSTEGGCDLVQVRRHDQELFPSQAESTWPIFQMQAAIRSWWLAEYSGFYLDDPPEAAIPPNTDLDEGRFSMLSDMIKQTLTRSRGSSKIETIPRGIEGRGLRLPLGDRWRCEIPRLA